MICAHCRRPLKHPAARVGRLLFGPVCARRLGLLAPPSVRYRVERDERTPDLFAGIAA